MDHERAQILRLRLIQDVTTCHFIIVRLGSRGNCVWIALLGFFDGRCHLRSYSRRLIEVDLYLFKLVLLHLVYYALILIIASLAKIIDQNHSLLISK